jgi:hypothetical protein
VLGIPTSDTIVVDKDGVDRDPERGRPVAPQTPDLPLMIS